MEKNPGPPKQPPAPKVIPRLPPRPPPQRPPSARPDYSAEDRPTYTRIEPEWVTSVDRVSMVDVPEQLKERRSEVSVAFQLRDEQLKARIQYYNGEAASNPELDAITERIADELRMLQQQSGSGVAAEGAVQDELCKSLAGHLERLFSGRRALFLQRKIETVQRRVTQLFFSSALYQKIADKNEVVPHASWPAQALYFGLKRAEDVVKRELEAIPVSDPTVRDEALSRFDFMLRNLASEFLSQTTPELERILELFRSVLLDYFSNVFTKQLLSFSTEVIKESRVAAGHPFGYKLTADRFASFRRVFDRKFLELTVSAFHEPMADAVAQEEEGFRTATIQFVLSPEVHSEICAVMSDSIYDYLHGEGYLDLPVDWRQALAGPREFR